MTIPDFESIDTLIIPNFISHSTFPDGSDTLDFKYVYTNRPFNEVTLKLPSGEILYFKYDGAETGFMTIGEKLEAERQGWMMYEYWVIDEELYPKDVFFIAEEVNGKFNLNKHEITKEFLKKAGFSALDRIFIRIAFLFQLIALSDGARHNGEKECKPIKIASRKNNISEYNCKSIVIHGALPENDIHTRHDDSINKACEFTTLTWNTRGHFRHLKNGNRIWVRPHSNSRNKLLLSKRAKRKHSICVLSDRGGVMTNEVKI